MTASVDLRRDGKAAALPDRRLRARAIAFYLPQYHPTKENDAWWGPGFTEWTNVAKARPRFPGHYQPHVPGDLGYYDLRVPETRAAQAQLARSYGVEAFCYYHYWFAGRRILERPFDEVLAGGEPDFPFCISWANHSWEGTWAGFAQGKTLLVQTYPGDDDHRRHFEALLPAFLDRRYVKVDGKPLFMVYRPLELPEAPRALELWRTLAQRAGLPGLYLACEHYDPAFVPESLGFDASLLFPFPQRRQWGWRRPHRKLYTLARERLGCPYVVSYAGAVRQMILPPVEGIRSHPCVIPGWDNSARSGVNGTVLQGSTPERFRTHVRTAIARAEHERAEERFLFIRAWNEWAEGNHLEPDVRWGHGYLNVLHEELSR